MSLQPDDELAEDDIKEIMRELGFEPDYLQPGRSSRVWKPANPPTVANPPTRAVPMPQSAPVHRVIDRLKRNNLPLPKRLAHLAG